MENEPAGRIFVEGAHSPWENAAPGLQRQVLSFDDHLMMVRVRFEKNALGAMHTHPHRQVTAVESGSFEVIVDGQKKLLNPGDSFFVPPDVPHSVLAAEEGSLLDVFTPARRDFLNSEQLW
jgi:quercetin dioxygenase-like cupin family protein